MKRFLLFLPLVALLAACGDDSTGPGTPVLSGVSPARGTAGTEVEITGSSFSADDVQVFFGTLESPRVQLDGGALYALAPQGLEAGTTYDVRVVNGGSAEATLADAFEAVPPSAQRINGVSKPTGLIGMTLIVEGDAFGDSLGLSGGKVYFEGTDGSPIEAAVADSAADWTNAFIVTRVPQGTADTSRVWVETATGASDSIEFRLISSGVFSPSTINWNSTVALPQPLTGLGAVFVPVEDGAAPANYVFAIGGEDTLGAATPSLYRAQVQQTGALDAWTELSPLPAARAYHATVAATAYTAALDTATTAAVLYVIGGIDDAGETVSTVHYAAVGLDGAVGDWQTATALPAPLHSAGAVLFRGYLYLAGGAGADSAAVADAYRARVNADGGLGEWESVAALPEARAYYSLVNFGPYVYAVGGETATSAPEQATQTNTETGAVALARINLRNGALHDAGWTALTAMGKTRSKHGTLYAGGALFVTSGVYAGNPGSSENTYGSIDSDGTITAWNGATGSETIGVEIGYSLYNQAVVSFVDDAGTGHVLVLGGANRADGVPSAAVVYY